MQRTRTAHALAQPRASRIPPRAHLLSGAHGSSSFGVPAVALTAGPAQITSNKQFRCTTGAWQAWVLSTQAVRNHRLKQAMAGLALQQPRSLSSYDEREQLGSTGRPLLKNACRKAK